MISLSLMISYIKHRQYSAKSKYFGPFYYIQIDPQDYDEWRTSPPEEEIHFQTPSKFGSPTTPQSTVFSEASESYITLTNFKKGIKRDASAYPIFKNERYYNTFICHFKATAKAQGLNSLMDPNFTPGSDEHEQQLFQEQQDFLYSVLISSLKTEFSEALVKDHEGDAQLILELLHEHHTGNSQYSIAEFNRITKYLTNIRLDDTWSGTNESFLMHYNDQLRLLDSLVDSGEKVPDNARVTKTETTPSDPLLAMVHQSIHTSDDDASDISNVLSVKRSRQIQVCQCYLFQHANHTNQQLVDCGANGGLAGSDMHVIHKTHRKINIQGIDNHEVTGLDVVTAATLLNTSQGKVIGIFNEYAYLGKGSSIHSSGQLEWFKTNVDEKSVIVGGTQLITTLDGYSVPLLIKDGLAYATSLGRPTDQDMDTYPHVFFTSPDEWDPSVLDHDPPHLDGLDPSQVPNQPFGDPMFDAYGDFNERIIANLNILLDAPPEDCGSYTEISSVFTANLHQSSPQEPNWNPLHPFFAWTSPSSIKNLSMSPPGMGLLHTPRITSKSTLSLAILFSTSPDAMKLLQQTPSLIQFPPEMDENWVRYGLAKLGQISKLPNWQRMLFCAYTTQLLHSTGEVCWNNKDSYFIWFKFVCRNSGQIASRRSWKRSCLGLEYTSKCSRLAPLWEPN